jgi:predicted aspartyl protease
MLLFVASIAETRPADVPKSALQAEPGKLMLHFTQGADWAPLSYEVVQGEILFQATVNGRPATVLLDNGTGRTVIDAGFARMVGVALSSSADAAVTGAATRMATQATGHMTLAAAHAFTITGSLVALDLKPMSAALGRQIDAVLGGDMLDNFAIMVQPAKRMLSLAPSGSISVKSDAIVVPIVDGNAVEAELNGRPVRVKVDLGFNGVIRLTDAAWQSTFPAGSVSAPGSQTTADGVTRITKAGHADLRIGRVKLRNVPVDSGYVSEGADGLLGNGFLLRGTSVLDVKKRQLMLVPRQPVTG